MLTVCHFVDDDRALEITVSIIFVVTETPACPDVHPHTTTLSIGGRSAYDRGVSINCQPQDSISLGNSQVGIVGTTSILSPK
jgi:hypothetical protein